ncbi:MAG: response regulator [Deltaproteobacteria bacterium]|nr:MAG: response regulator [Deltaproteobacteria bacterium]
MRIAIVEDDALLRESLALFLRVRRCRVETYGSAEEAGETTKPGRFDIVISDYLLPGEDGLSLLRRVREASGNTGTMLITAHARLEVPREAQAAGIDSFLMKPFSTKDLESALLRIVVGGVTGSERDVEANG